MDLFSVLYGLSLGEANRGNVVGRTEIGEYTVDTCYTMDAGYETGIWKGDGNIIIVENYEDEEDATIGHDKWCKFVKTNPTEAYSVQWEEKEKF